MTMSDSSYLPFALLPIFDPSLLLFTLSVIASTTVIKSKFLWRNILYFKTQSGTNGSKTKKGETNELQKNDEDEYYLNLCHEIRLSINPKPRQSNFRVVCILLLNDNNDNKTWIAGTNDEPTVCISGSICAERCALLQYRIEQYTQSIKTVYIVSDCIEAAIPPGMLCREYMYGHDAISISSTRIVLQASYDPNDKMKAGSIRPTPWIVSLRELYPHPSIYNRLDSTEQVLLGTKLENEGIIQQCVEKMMLRQHQRQQQRDDDSDGSGEVLKLPDDCTISKLIDAAKNAAIIGNKTTSSFHPISYGAAAYIEMIPVMGNDDDNNNTNYNCNNDKNRVICDNDGNVQQRKQATATLSEFYLITSYQRKALEYGATQDAVCQLMSAVSHHVACKNFYNNNDYTNDVKYNAVVSFIVQTDQFGIPHAPFAQARSLLVEHGYGDCSILVLTKSKNHNNSRSTTTPRGDGSCSADDTTQPDGNNNSIRMNNVISSEESPIPFYDLLIVEAKILAPFVPKFR